jgi:outer membrane receptor for ferrienterochelin and colicins
MYFQNHFKKLIKFMKKLYPIHVLKRIFVVQMIFLTLGLSQSNANIASEKVSCLGKLPIFTINGSVEDGTSKMPLVGASVVLKGTSKGTLTDANGRYSLAVDDNEKSGILVISYVGYNSQEVSIKGQTTINITLNEDERALNEVVVSASRKAEKVQDAPASVSVISSKTLQAASSAIDPVRELANVPGVHIQQQSASTINIGMRGSSDLFGTSVFPILDYRSLVAPGIGAFKSDAAGLNSIDLERIEVVRGPGSALYGPGVTSGVVHFMSKSPIDHPGTTVELIGGELSTFGASIRHAIASKDKKLGFKVNAHYKRGNEFTLDPSNADDAKQIKMFQKRIVNPIIGPEGFIAADQSKAPVVLTQQQLDPDGDGNMMANVWSNLALNGTLELRPRTDTKVVLAGGYNQGSSVFYNSQGEGLVQGKEFWSQARLQKSGLFAQIFYVNNDGGQGDKPTILYQTGNISSIARQQLEGQLQYNFDLKKLLNSNITVGADYRKAISNSENRVYGRNENNDDYSMQGVYAQGKFELANKIDLVLAGRYDNFNFLDKGAFSPRVAMVYKASPTQTFRASFNRAFAPPSAINLYLDFPVAAPIPGLFDLWIRGNKEAQNFAATPMIDLTAPGMPDLPYGIPGLPLAIPYGAVTPAILQGLGAALPADIFKLVQGILTNPANAPKGITGTFTGYNLLNGLPLTPVNNPSATLQEDNTIEIGYKGTFNNKFSVSLDLYRISTSGFTNATAISPTIRYTDTGLAVDLGKEVGATVTAELQKALIAGGMPAATAAATAAQIGGAVGGAYTQGGAAFSSQIAPLSGIFGVVETQSVPNDGLAHMAMGYRTYGQTSYWGSDLSLGYQINNDLGLFFNYSMVSKNVFTEEDLGEAKGSGLTASLNIPKSKYRLGAIYAPAMGWRGNVSFQHDDSFVANFGQYSGPTDVKNLIDAGVGYKLKSGLSIDLTCTNVFDSKYRALPNMPQIGRRAIAKLTYTFSGK